jgi:Putative adhesin
MKTLMLGLAFTLAIAPSVFADQWTKTYSVAGKPELRVEASDANVHVDTWEQNTIDVRVTTGHYKIGDGGIKIDEHQSGDSVSVELRFPHHVTIVGWNSYRVDIEIHMPKQGKVDLKTGDGNIELRNLKGEMELETGDGRQEINGVDGTLNARSGDGRITVEGRFDALRLNTGDGRIEARALAGSAVASDWELRTGDGSVTLALPQDLAADVDLRTSDGHITLDVPVTINGGTVAEHNVQGKLNGGGNSLSVHTGDGSIRIEKSI